MKLTGIISLLVFILLIPIGTAPAQEAQATEQKNCSFNIIGTWKAQASTKEARLYRFDADGLVTVLSVSGDEEPHQIATGRYKVIDEIDEPKSIAFTANGKDRIFGAARKTMKVVSFDDSSITCAIPGVGTTRWTRVDPERYFIVLAARNREFYDTSGTAFTMVIKATGDAPAIDVVGIYPNKEKTAAFGAVPPETYKAYLREAKGDSEVLLRLEINSQQYQRALGVIKEWQRRAREDALLYDQNPLNNILVVKAVTETLNQCSEDFDFYKLDYLHPQDWITDQTSPEFVPFVFFKELRRRNEARHIDDKTFQELVPVPNLASR